MLVLSRKEGQSIQIGPDIIVKISSISGNRVKVAIEAPREVGIHRAELREPDLTDTIKAATDTSYPARPSVTTKPSTTCLHLRRRVQKTPSMVA